MNNTPLRIQDCPPNVARTILQTKQYIEHYVKDLQGATMLIACSGGADSLSLLFTLHYLKKYFGYSLCALHLNHQLRKEAEEEKRYVGRICSILGVPFIFRDEDVASYAKEHNLGIEEAGRDCRYAFFEEQRALYERAYICTGHHANDLAEDVFLRLIRGTSVDMLIAMPAFSLERGILRPLLHTPKAVLVDFLEQLGVTWCEDATNKERDHLRSRIRLDVIPFFIKENPHFLEKVTSLHTQSEWDRDFWEEVLGSYPLLEIPYKDLCFLHKAGRMRLYRRAFVALHIQPTSTLFMKIDDAVISKNKKIFHLPDNCIARTTATGIIFEKGDAE